MFQVQFDDLYNGLFVSGNFLFYFKFMVWLFDSGDERCSGASRVTMVDLQRICSKWNLILRDQAPSVAVKVDAWSESGRGSADPDVDDWLDPLGFTLHRRKLLRYLFIAQVLAAAAVEAAAIALLITEETSTAIGLIVVAMLTFSAAYILRYGLRKYQYPSERPPKGNEQKMDGRTC